MEKAWAKAVWLVAVFLLACPAEIIGEAEPEPEPEPERALEVFDGLVAWIRDEGGHVGRVDVRGGSTAEFGVFATENILNGTEMVRIPKSVVLNREAIAQRGGDEDQALLDIWGSKAFRHPAVAGQGLLAMFLALEREKEDSPWRPYFRTLPRRIPTLPLYLSAEEIKAEAAGSTFYDSYLHWNFEILKEFRQWQSAFKKFGLSRGQHVTLGQFRDSFSVVLSRAVEFNGTLCLTPLIDMFNSHTKSVHFPVESEEDGRIVLSARDGDIPADAEVFSSYGIHRQTPAQTAYTFGYVSKQNIRNLRVKWNLEINESVPNWEVKFAALFRFGNYTFPSEVHVSVEDLLPVKLLVFSRVMAHNFADPAAYLPLFKEGVDPDNVSAADREALKNIMRLFYKTLGQYPTTAEHDEGILSSLVKEPAAHLSDADEGSVAKLNIVQLRLMEKTLLVNAIQNISNI